YQNLLDQLSSSETETELTSDTMSEDDPELTAADYGTNLYLVLTGITNQNVSITAHNVIGDPSKFFQLLSKPNLLDLDWKVEQQFTVVINEEPLPLDPVDATNKPQLFFWAAEGDTLVSVFHNS